MAVAAVAAAVAVKEIETMNILEKLGFKNTNKDTPIAAAPKELSANPHDNGGCCGGCGGTQEEQS